MPKLNYVKLAISRIKCQIECSLVVLAAISWKLFGPHSFFCLVLYCRRLPSEISVLVSKQSFFGRCLTNEITTGTIESGPCPYIAHYNTTYVYSMCYIRLPMNVSLFTELMCGPLNREGEVCGKCRDGYGIALYSYTLECSKCWGHGYGWILYWALELFPITVMYLVVVISM